MSGKAVTSQFQNMEGTASVGGVGKDKTATTRRLDPLRDVRFQNSLLLELKLLRLNSPSGVFVIPSLKSLQVWHGVIFLFCGPLSGGVFRFEIVLPDGYPRDPPVMKFTSKIFHPQVHPNGLLNLSEEFPVWKSDEHKVWHILLYAKRCLESLNTWQPSNERATATVYESIAAFQGKSQACVLQSLQDVETSFAESDSAADHGNCLQFSDISPGKCKQYIEEMKSQALRNLSDSKKF
ncbi:protein crossbronx homolog [Oscarella lobularis]|uniref:protein crossbronx homolog n=1 Tax=Oscarella lobularis TaxID=121494 RepID=UPI0033135764